MILPEHLGGHKGRTHLDHGVLEFMIKKYNIKTMLDIGCGPGGLVQLARELGINSYGIDGDFTLDRVGDYFYIHDYSIDKSAVDLDVDFAWSCEFVEHVNEEYIPNYMADFQKAKYVVMTFSEKGGHHHVNIKPANYWIEVFESYGFKYDDIITAEVRDASTMNTTGKFTNKQYVKTNGLFFYRK
jgi:SAM-dependent methyltransferase